MPDVEVGEQHAGTNAISRRRFIGYLIAAPTLVAAADLRAAPPARASVATVQPVDFYDLTDLLTDAAILTASLITVTLNPDGTASFALPRAEVGQGITTAVAMVLADELELPLDKVDITLSDARPELEFNQLTGGSNSIHSLYDQVRVAAAIARGQLARTAAKQLETPVRKLTLKNGVVTAADGRSLSYGSLAGTAATASTRAVLAQLKPASQQTLVGTPQPRIDAVEIVTGTKRFAMDLDVPGALPTMVCRPPTINGTALAVLNEAQVRAMNGVTDVAIIPHTQFVPGGVAVRATTFGQCIDAIRALQVQWAPGAAAGKSDADVLQALVSAELPMTPVVGQTLDERFTFYFRPGDPLETNCAIADVGPGSAEIWSSLKSPIYFQETVAADPRTARIEREGTRDPRRRVVRPPPVRRRGVRGGGDLEGDGEAGQADVAPDGQLPPGTRAPDVHLASADHLSGEQRAGVRPAPYECGDGLHARAGRDPERDGGRPT